ncbi:MAG: NAD(P)H-hydrate epimerase/ ADP-dependent (S)-NAD(P)H-hydrate dehydratase [Rhodanobacteraceae bacterium]|jgi:NAD(P)H-hydrate epimerase|nr:MAG: NAD(P)H-hydrate epimerase/ ADP-dependent (S)-NAD(P)H-hydrate dehydratase [Rhodanobacteraceae bacterium]
MPNPDPQLALYTTAQVRALDQAAIAAGIPGIELMERAARAAFDALRRRWPQARTLCVLCGPGNNGGDGFLMAALARAAGIQANVVATSEHSVGDAALARERCLREGGRVLQVASDLPDADVYVDALFGSGLNRAPSGDAAALIAAVNAQPKPVLALDVPSGLDSDTGVAFAPCVRATATVCFVGWKRGLFTAQGPDQCGERTLATLDIPERIYAQADPDAVLLTPQALPPRHRDSHKGRYGHVLAIGGDLGAGGAVRMCGEAAARVGAGLVSIATREANVGAILSARPELMPQGVHVPRNLEPLLARASVLAVGPGLGQDDWGRGLWQVALDAAKPTVLDADGLNLLAAAPRALPEACVLTPHPGEAAHLLGTTTAGVQADRFAAARALAQQHRAVVALKGAGSLIADPEGRIAVCPWGNPGMASGGMGDVLTGVIAGLLAQGLSPWNAACLGVGLHARAGDLAARAGERGLLASDLFAYLRALVNGRVAG